MKFFRVDDHGVPLTDDAGRPKLKMRPHDFEVGGFFDIVQRNGSAAVEAQVIGEVGKKFIQLGLFSGDDNQPEVA